MRWWSNLVEKFQELWSEQKNQKVFFSILLGLALIAGIGLGILRHGLIEEPPAIEVIHSEDLESIIQARVQSVLAESYPWILEEPQELVRVDLPITPLPNPEATRPEPEAEVSFEHLIWPVQGEVATSFGWYRHPVYGDWRFNSGLEFSVTGDSVRTVLPGEVLAVKTNGLETELVINHGSGWESTYRSISGIAVIPGEKVEQNQTIASPEQNGRVFFGLSHNGDPVNPQAFLR